MDSTTRMEMHKTAGDSWNLDVLVTYFDLSQSRLLELQEMYFNFLNDVVELMEPEEEESE